MKAFIFILGAALSQSAQAEKVCYRVQLDEVVNELTCGQVQTHVSSVDCLHQTLLKDYGPQPGQVDCEGSPKKIHVFLDQLELISELKSNNLWGDKSLQASDTVVQPRKSVAKAKRVRALPPALPTPRLSSPPANPPVVSKDSEPVAAASAPPPVASGVEFKFSGFAWFETEDSRNFGYTLPSQYSTQNFFSNLQLELSKEDTHLVSVFEVNELFGGDSQTGGQQGGRTTPVKTRNIYLSQDLDKKWNFKVGLQSLASDPNGYIISDNYSAAVLSSHQEVGDLSLWFAQAYLDKPGTDPTNSVHAARDQYLGLRYKVGDDSRNATFYVVQRDHVESLYDPSSAATVSGKSKDDWVGVTAGTPLFSWLSWQASAIWNSGSFSADAVDAKDKYTANLTDLKWNATWAEQALDFQIEGLRTSGSSDAIQAGQSQQTLGHRGGFSSPDPGAAYLLTIATSDGADEAPGSTKQSIIGNLSQPQGLNVVILKINKAWNDKLSSFLRFGTLRSTEKNSQTDASDMGNEWDFNMTYSLSKSTSLLVDYGLFRPGPFYISRDPAELFTSRLKFSF